MPIYEYYCSENHTIYQFYAKTLAQGKTIPKCPHNPAYRMEKMLSLFAVTGGTPQGDEVPPSPSAAAPGESAEDAKMEAAINAMEGEFAHVDENDPRAMGRMMRRMAEMTGEKIDENMEEIVRKLEEGSDPDALDEELGGEAPCQMPDPALNGANDSQEPRQRFRVPLRAPRRDAKLYDYE